MTFTSSEYEGFQSPSLNDLYENIIDRTAYPCNQLETVRESKESTPSQFLIGVCFNRGVVPNNSSKGKFKKEPTRAKRHYMKRRGRIGITFLAFS